jgi:hypothetical protein
MGSRCGGCGLDLGGQVKVVMPKHHPNQPCRVLCEDCFDEQRINEYLAKNVLNTAENGPPWVEVCEDHWHCDPLMTSHACSKPDRTKPCPSCNEK